MHFITGMNTVPHMTASLITALDLLAAHASQAYIKRVFSVCGLLTQGRRNRLTKSLEMRARLKLNAKAFV